VDDASTPRDSTDDVGHATAWTPLRFASFRALWSGNSAMWMAVWSFATAAQWYLVGSPETRALTPLIQTSLMLPMTLLTLPAGVLGDTVDRRRLISWMQGIAVLALGAAAIAAFLGRLPGVLLLVVAVVTGCTTALTFVPFQSLTPELVPRRVVPSAAALVSVGINAARMVGPAVAGALLAFLGITPVLALCVGATAFFLVTVRLWDGGAPRPHAKAEFLPAFAEGLRVVRALKPVRQLMLRVFLFGFAMVILFTTIPLIAAERLNLTAGVYGATMAATGAGAVTGGLLTARLQRYLSVNALLGLGGAFSSVAIVLMPFAGSAGVLALLMFVAGYWWTTSLSTAAGAVQLFMPRVFVARGIATYNLAPFGGQAVGSYVLGYIAVNHDITAAHVVAAGLLAVTAVLSLVRPLTKQFGSTAEAVIP